MVLLNITILAFEKMIKAMIENINGSTFTGNVSTAYVDLGEYRQISKDSPKENIVTSTQTNTENEASDTAGGTLESDSNVSTAYVDL